jgi:hypothetical protein
VTKALLISYHFPPGQAAGALRWEKLTRLGVERGWAFDVVSAHPDDLVRLDTGRAESLPTEVGLYGAHAGHSRLERLEAPLRAARAYLRRSRETSAEPADAPVSSAGPNLIPRDEVRFEPLSRASWKRAHGALIEHGHAASWGRHARRVGRRLLASGTHELIVSCGPPHIAHETARRLARASGLSFAMDLRDPWASVDGALEYYASPLWFRIAERLEAHAVSEAALVVMNTEPARDVMRERYPERAADIIAVPNGFDDEPSPEPTHGHRFLIAYAGTVYIDRSPENLLQATQRVIDRLDLGPHDIGVELMGQMGAINGRSVEQMARDAGVEAYVRTHPPGTLAEVERFMAAAAVAVSLPQAVPQAIPSKIFDYMRFPAHLLVLATPDNAAARLLRGSSAHVVDPANVEGLARLIQQLYTDYRAGRRPEPMTQYAEFSRRHRADQLFSALDSVLTGR